MELTSEALWIIGYDMGSMTATGGRATYATQTRRICEDRVVSKECRKKEAAVNSTAPCCPPKPACCAGSAGDGAETDGPLAYFDRMTGRCLEYAEAAKEAGRPVVGIMCEYTPRELILAAGGVPVCLCGGSAEMIPSAEEHQPAHLCPLIKST